MLQRCDTQRANTTEDSYRASRPEWRPKLNEVRCRLVVKTQNRGPDSIAEQPIVTSYLLLLPNRHNGAPIDVQEGDRIVNVVTQDGAVIAAGPFIVQQVLPRRARALRHISLILERVS